jgi:hypothetical protein
MGPTLRRGIRMDARRYTGQLGMDVKLLLERGADIGAKDNGG